VLVPLAAVAAGRAARVPERVGELFAMTTWRGRVVVPAHFELLTPLRGGRAAAMRGGRWGFVDARGQWVGQPKYDWVDTHHFDHGPALVSVNGRYGYLSRDGREIVAPVLEQASPFHGGVACVVDPQAMKAGLIDAEGLPITGYRFDACDPVFSSGRARVRIGALWGYVDRAGEIALPARYERAEPFSEGLALVEEAGLRAFIGPQGERVAPAGGEEAGSFSEGRAWIRYGPDQVGFIDARGRRIVAPHWRRAQDFADGVAWVQDPETSRWALIDREGAIVAPPAFEDPGPFVDGLARVAIDGQYGIVDRSGRLVVPARYTAMADPAEGLVSVALEPGGLRGAIDVRGALIVPAIYEQIGPFRDGLAQATRCRWVTEGARAKERHRCDVVYVDRRGRERSRALR